MKITLHNQTLHLHPAKAIFWEERSTLLLADLHLGKGEHFSRNGMPVPRGVQDDNFTRLQELLDHFEPERVLFLGDLFHSQLNNTVETFALFLSTHPEVSFELVLGNHDILPQALYDNSQMVIHRPPLREPPFIFTHYPYEKGDAELYNLYGHLHPGVLLQGAGKETFRLPCFQFERDRAVLPAFGAFTGLAIVKPARNDRVFVIVEGEVIEV
ncbi:MAG: ligase-associated DNA damage response endonuclease PdeM [Bacteroidota bacterium]